MLEPSDWISLVALVVSIAALVLTEVRRRLDKSELDDSALAWGSRRWSLGGRTASWVVNTRFVTTTGAACLTAPAIGARRWPTSWRALLQNTGGRPTRAYEATWRPVGRFGCGSDFFEELLVNPTLLTIARQRGNLDCGGLRHVIVGYGNFNQVILETHEGHLSVCVELDRDPVRVAAQVADMLERRGWSITGQTAPEAP
jgi:hypothetical protein